MSFHRIVLSCGAFIFFTGVSLCAKTVVLTDNTTSCRLRRANTIIVNSDVDLRGRILTLPKKAVLVFERGSVSNGDLILRNNKLCGDVKVLSKVSGTVKNDTLYVNWFLKNNDLDVIYNSGVMSVTGMKELHLRPGDYVLSVRRMNDGILLNDLVLDGEGCTITAKEGGSLVYPLLPFYGCENLIVKNLNLVGSKISDKEAGARHNLALAACEGIVVQNVVSREAHTDGLYIIDCNNVTVSGYKAYLSGRQGCSITSGTNIFLKDCVFDGTHGFAPMAGLDIEPNSELDKIDNIQIERCSFSNNESAGLTILLRTRNKKLPCNIKICDCTFNGNNFHISVSSAPNSGTGLIDISNCELSNSKGVSFQSKCYSAIGTPVVKFHDSSLENANVSGGSDVREQATFISVHNLSSASVQSDYGNIQFYNLTIKQEEAYEDNLRRVVNLYPDEKWEIRDVSISNITYDIKRKDDSSFQKMFVPSKKLNNVKVE